MNFTSIILINLGNSVAVLLLFLKQAKFQMLPYFKPIWVFFFFIFAAPFYYIDYCLAQICAFQFWLLDEKDHDLAWSNYLRLCKAGGSGSFLELVELAGLESPFNPGVIESVAARVSERIQEMSL